METLLRAKDYIYQENIKLPTAIEPTIQYTAIQDNPAMTMREAISIWEDQPEQKPAKRCKFCQTLFHPVKKEKCCSTECDKKQAALQRREYIEIKKSTMIIKMCKVCFELFETSVANDRETCSEKCHHILGAQANIIVHEVYHSGCVDVEMEARKVGLHYRDIQKRKSLRMAGKIDVTLGGIL